MRAAGVSRHRPTPRGAAESPGSGPGPVRASTTACASLWRMSTPADLPVPGDVAAVDVYEVAGADELRDTDIGGDDTVVHRSELPLEADPADVVEQDATVPYDDER